VITSLSASVELVKPRLLVPHFCHSKSIDIRGWYRHL
jgi:hypothetical protein